MVEGEDSWRKRRGQWGRDTRDFDNRQCQLSIAVPGLGKAPTGCASPAPALPPPRRARCSKLSAPCRWFCFPTRLHPRWLLCGVTRVSPFPSFFSFLSQPRRHHGTDTPVLIMCKLANNGQEFLPEIWIGCNLATGPRATVSSECKNACNQGTYCFI